jgi:lysozyme
MSLSQAREFVQKIQQATGHWPTLYSGNMVKSHGENDPILTKCPLWLAEYATYPRLPTGWPYYSLWQYTDGNYGPSPHTVGGIGACDRDTWNGTEDSLRRFWGS